MFLSPLFDYPQNCHIRAKVIHVGKTALSLKTLLFSLGNFQLDFLSKTDSFFYGNSCKGFEKYIFNIVYISYPFHYCFYMSSRDRIVRQV